MSVMNDAVEGQPTEGQDEFPAELQPLLDQGVELLYGDNFEKLVQMFQGGPQNFPRAMATAINAVLSRIGKDHGALDQQAAAHIGTKLFGMLLEDLITGGAIEQVTPQMAVEAIQMTMAMWLRENQDQVDPNEAGQSLFNLAAAMKEGGVLEQNAGQQQQMPAPPSGVVQ